MGTITMDGDPYYRYSRLSAMSRTPRFFKFALIAFLAVICLLLVTRNRIYETSQLINFKSETSFDDNIQAIVDSGTAESEAKELQGNEELRQEEEIEDEQAEDIAEVQAEDGGEEQANEVEQKEDPDEPPDDSLPGAYLKYYQPAPTNQSHCKYNYDLPYDLVYTSKNSQFPPEQGNSSPYRIIYNVIEAYNLMDVPPITYATHMTANFAHFIPELLKHWDGLVTVAAFVPDLDVAFFIEQINQFCYCEPEMHRVSIHIVTHKMLPFSKKDIYFDRPQDCVPEDSSAVPIFSDYDETIFYPINVVRNAARTSALTKYILLSDSELIPSKGLASGFLQMVHRVNRTITKEVFHVPIFEVAEGTVVPEDKSSLVQLIQTKQAVYFHQTTCEHCQKFPNIDQWISSASFNEVKPFQTVKRHDPFHRWEPIFIGTNLEPLYSEQLSWEGLQDKMAQSLEMCLEDYSYTTLDNAFLCHWPGIKTAQNEGWRESFIEENEKNYANIVKGLLERYRDIPACKARFAVTAGVELQPNAAI
ncbi:hypothetical protein HUJ04_009375 [Dendroctonus ponderosae]|uniref:Glycosyltransferase family 92 protein n=3 Tax=Dendroctonus ponderosae TaxID=77166 RepID=A0AAR5NZQ8_DENPD|nr:hypothetical protein HUJ04_009358 [Dendroctonus ponderosae]KAH1019581.1 hypothetical protein HUJ04_009375 [Dendroctonus ponderosae]